MPFKFWAISNIELDNYYKDNPLYRGTYSKSDLPKQIKRGCYIINMGNSTHWISVINLDPKICLYFDPFGFIAPLEIIKFMKTSHKRLLYSTLQFQDIDSVSCGFWNVYFIDHMMNGIKYLDLMTYFQKNTRDNEKILKSYFERNKILNKNNSLVHGGSLFSKILDIPKRIVQFIKGPRDQYPPDVRQLIERYGAQIITNFRVAREPVKGIIDKIVNIITLGEYGKGKEKLHYDQVFHLYCIFQLHNGVVLRLENNHVIEMKKYDGSTPKEYVQVPITKRLSLAQFMANGPLKFPKNFFNYNPINNNCQNFMWKMLEASSIMTKEAQTFILQDAPSIFKTTPDISKRILTTITDLASRGDILVKGFGRKKI